MRAAEKYVMDEPLAWTNVSPSFSRDWMTNYVRPRMHTNLTLENGLLARGLFCFAQIFDYDRSNYAYFVVHAGGIDAPLSRQERFRSTSEAFETDELPASPQRRQTVPAARYADDLIRWIGCTYDELATMTGISRGAFFYWRRTGATPRAASLRPLLRLHSLVGALVRRFEEEGARAWLGAGNPAPRDLLLRGDVERVEDAFRRSLMGQPDRHSRYARTVSDREVPLVVTTIESQPKRADRRPKRGSPPIS